MDAEKSPIQMVIITKAIGLMILRKARELKYLLLMA